MKIFFKYPEVAKKNGVEGKVFIEFVINIDGSIDDESVHALTRDELKKLASFSSVIFDVGCQDEAIRILGLFSVSDETGKVRVDGKWMVETKNNISFVIIQGTMVRLTDLKPFGKHKDPKIETSDKTTTSHNGRLNFRFTKDAAIQRRTFFSQH